MKQTVIGAIGAIVAFLCFAIGMRFDTLTGKRSDAAATQILCYSDTGQPLWQPSLVQSIDMQSDPIIAVQRENGLKVYIKAKSCIAFEVNAKELETILKGKQPPPHEEPPPAPAPTPEKKDKK